MTAIEQPYPQAAAAPERPQAPAVGETGATGVGGFWLLVVLSLLVNLLFLTGPIFMMQVYDRVLPSGSIPTLIGLFGIAMVLYVAFGVFDAIRLQILALRGDLVASAYQKDAFRIAIKAAVEGDTGPRARAPEDVETVRGFLTSPSLVSLFDLPAIPLFFLVIVALHPVLGFVTIVACLILAGLALVNERLSRARFTAAQGAVAQSAAMLDDARNAAMGVSGNGMGAAVADAWEQTARAGQGTALSGARLLAGFSSLTKTFRLAIQSLVLGVGGWLAVSGVLTPGAMIAASIVFARAIAPVEQSLSNYRALVQAREAWRNITGWRDEGTGDAAPFALPRPSHAVAARGVSVAAPATGEPILRDVAFDLKAGDILGVIGASGAGKSTLTRALAGSWPIAGGRLVFDGADLPQWSETQRGDFIGYLPQSVELLFGTIADNISRFDSAADPGAIIGAAKAVQLHDLILALPDGYDTHIGPGGARLSGGQRQRVGLARAMFGDPFLLVLDEPAAHLDPEGRLALAAALKARADHGRISVFTSHDRALLGLATKLVSLQGGRMTASGPRDAVLEHLKAARSEAPV